MYFRLPQSFKMIKNIIQTLFTKGFVAIINFLILIISAKYLGVNTRGEISLFVLNIANIQIINEIYTGYSLVYFVPKFNLKKIVINGIVWTFITTAISNIVFYLLNKEIPGYEMDMFILSLLIILNTFNMVNLLAKEKVKTYNLLSVLQPLILLSGILFFVLFKKDYTFDAYVIPLYISFTVAFVISLVSVLKLIKQGDEKHEFSLRPILENGFFCQLAGWFHLLANRFSLYFFSTSAIIGLYSAASSLIEAVWIISTGISPIVLSKISNTGDTTFNRNIVLTLAKTSLFLSCIAVIIIYFLPNGLFTYLLGKDFSAIKSIMLWIAPGILFISFSTIISHYFSGLGKLKFVAFCNFTGFVLTLVLAPYLISLYGMKGAAIVANSSYFVSSLVLFIGFVIKAKISFSDVINFKKDIENIKQAF